MIEAIAAFQGNRIGAAVLAQAYADALRVLEAALLVPVAELGTTDDCGFAPFADDVSTARDVAFSKIGARVEGTELAARELGL